MDTVRYIGSLIFLGPLVTLGVLSILGLTSFKTREWLVCRIVAIGQSVSFFSALYIAYVMAREFLLTGKVEPIRVLHHHLFSFGHHSVEFVLQIDSLSIWFVAMAAILSNIVGVFSQHYLHRDVGFFRFFFLIVLFLTGILTVFMGTNFQVVFIGWELVGIASALLISFFTLRRETIDNALHAFWAYRVSDVGLLCGSVLLATYSSGYTFGAGHGRQLPEPLYYLLPFLLLFSAMGKSAQFPFPSWLPRAMEGPTSSSAIFYGGLSIHAGVYLMMRLRLEYDVPFVFLVAMGAVGAVSCLYGALLTQVQSDVKSALAYASLSQVGIMFVEIACGWYYIALLHCMGHAFLRTYQILKCSSVIHQFVEFEDAHQFAIAQSKATVLSVLASPRRVNRIFSFAFDMALRAASGPSSLVVGLERVSRFLQGLEDRWISFISRVPLKDVTGR